MPPVIPVKSLYSIVLDKVTSTLYHSAATGNFNSDDVRKYLLRVLHSGIRQDLISSATKKYKADTGTVRFSTACKYNTYKLFDLIGLVLDSTIRRLHPIDQDSFLWINECHELFSCLENCQAVGLEELSVRVRINPRHDLEFVSIMNTTFHRVLYKMTNLRVLILRSICDNEMLRLIGEHCPKLEHLDMTSSWLVDDRGIRHLLLKNPMSFYENDYSTSADCEKTACCAHLKVVRIQDTNTTELGVIMLLLFIPQLRSLGGFIYYRNVGDAILSLLDWKPSLFLRLTDLWDTHLPDGKSEKLIYALPGLQSLYTRGTYLPRISAWKFLTSLTIDFDFRDFGALLEDFLAVCGPRLQKLAIVDQVHAMNLESMCQLCPALTELTAKICCDIKDGRWRMSPKSRMPLLKIAKVRLETAEVLPALLLCTPELTNLEIFYEQDGTSPDLDDVILSQALQSAKHAADPPCLELLYIRTESSLGWLGLMDLLTFCPNLKCVGDLYHWSALDKTSLEQLEELTIIRNWNLTILFQGVRLSAGNFLKM
ncbi:uncharacterized protein LOC135944920 [Cloeon dipterum]|uniref:uncharacterized protein LOC135944920 n=1 Tax=Cloeon dipterum TaxID=197152 RepID=UPI003220145C